MRTVFLLCFFMIWGRLLSQDTAAWARIHFLYGSKPKKEFKHQEVSYFGGLHGGHVSIELDSVDVGFVPAGGFHIFPRKKNRKSAFSSSPTQGRPVYPEGMKTLTIEIPLNKKQYKKLDSILGAYAKSTPYDYAFFGMRCAAATYEILAQINITDPRSRFRVSKGIFYPKLLRKKLIPLAEKMNYKLIRQEGKRTRKWESD